MKEKSKAVMYARESNHNGANISLEQQKERVKAFCNQNGFEVIDEISTIGSRQECFESLKKAIECAKNTDSKTLVMASSNRVVGTAADLTAVSALIKEAGVTIITLDNSMGIL